MFLADYHVHSDCSSDAMHSMTDMALAAAERGISQLCFTDHVDTDAYETGEFDPDCFERVKDQIKESFSLALKDVNNKIDIRLGLELGEINHHPEFAEQIAGEDGLDFVIGSIHSLNGMPDFCMLDYKSDGQCRQLAEKYISEHFELAECNAYDVIGHIGYINRYMGRAGFNVDILNYKEELFDIFRTLVRNGKGIEVNTSGIRQGIGTMFPTIEIVKLYKQAGGEIITVGSDAHNMRDVGSDIEDAYSMLREIGFKYFSVFKNRKAEFIKF